MAKNLGAGKGRVKSHPFDAWVRIHVIALDVVVAIERRFFANVFRQAFRGRPQTGNFNLNLCLSDRLRFALVVGIKVVIVRRDVRALQRGTHMGQNVEFFAVADRRDNRRQLFELLDNHIDKLSEFGALGRLADVPRLVVIH